LFFIVDIQFPKQRLTKNHCLVARIQQCSMSYIFYNNVDNFTLIERKLAALHSFVCIFVCLMILCFIGSTASFIQFADNFKSRLQRIDSTADGRSHATECESVFVFYASARIGYCRGDRMSAIDTARVKPRAVQSKPTVGRKRHLASADQLCIVGLAEFPITRTNSLENTRSWKL